MMSNTTFAAMFLAVTTFLTPMASAEAPPPETQVYTVDLRKAVLGTEAGRRIKAKLEDRRRAEEQKIRASEAALERDKARLSPEGYRARFREIQTQIEEATARLEAEQDRLLTPILDQMHDLIAEVERPGVVVLDVSVEAPVGLDAQCDRTSRLVEAYEARADGSPPSFGPKAKACEVSGFLFVHFDRVVKELPESRSALAKLDALQAKRQDELEKQKKRLAEVRYKAKTTNDARWRQEAVHRAQQLEKTFRAYQEEIRTAELKAQETLYERVERALSKFRGRHDGLLFVEYFDSAPSRPRSCEVSEWAAKLVKGQGGLRTLRQVCPWLS